MRIERNIVFWTQGRTLLSIVPLAAAAGVLIRFALRRYLASPLYTGSRQT